MRVLFNHYVKTRVTFTVYRSGPGPGPGKLGPGPARSPQNNNLPARACMLQARTWPGPQNIVEVRPLVHTMRNR